MKDLSIYFQPITTAVPFNDSQLGSYIDANHGEFPELNEPGCAIFEVPEYRGSIVGFGIQNTDFREHLHLTVWPTDTNIAEGKMEANITLTDFEQTCTLQFLRWDGYAVVWVALG